MDPGRWARLRDLFDRVRSATPAERDALLAATAGTDPELAAELRSLLAADALPGPLDAGPPVPSLTELLDESLPERIGPYLVAGEIGRGGMGVVCRAFDERLHREIALKLLPRALVHDTTARERFVTEARAASALDHPNICTIHDIGETADGRLFLAMALHPRGTLADRLEPGPMPVTEALEIARQLAGALHAAHEAGIVHRDVKPRNIAFGEQGEVRLLDFGVALLGGGAHAASGSTAGTPGYMAPEQVRGQPVDRRADIWALGAVLFEMLSGQRPFTGPDHGTVVQAIRERTPPDLRSLAPAVPASVAGVVMRALSKEPDARYATAAAMAADLTAALTQLQRAPFTHRRSRRVIAVVALLLLVPAVGVIAVLRGRAPAAAAAHLDERTVAVLPFRISSEPALEYLREGMVDLLAARLTGAGGMRAADTRTTLTAWQRAFGSSDVPADSAVQFARRLGAGRVLLGDVVGTEASIVVNASVLDARGRVTERASVQGRTDELVELVDRLVAQLLSLNAGEDPQRLAALTSTSLPALRSYLDGQAAYRAGRHQDALLHYTHALQHDSTFALAGMGLAFAAGWVSGAEQARERGHEVAWRFRQRLSERDRALLFALVGPAFPRPASVRELLHALEQALHSSPDHAELWFELGDRYFHFGRVLDGRSWREQAEGALLRSLQLDPDYGPALHHLVALYAESGRRDALQQAAAAYLARDSTGATADYIRWRLAAAAMAPARAAPALETLDNETLGWIAMNALDDGVALSDGLRAAELLAARHGTKAQQFQQLMALYSFAANTGRLALAGNAAARLQEVQPDPSFVQRLHVLGALYGDADAAAAAAAAGELERRAADDLDRCVLGLWLQHLHPANAEPAGTLALRPARSEAELPRMICDAVLAASHEVQATRTAGPRVVALENLLRDGPVQAPTLDGHTEYAHAALARLLLQAGEHQRALTAARRRVYFIGWHPYLATLLREEARLAEQTGDRNGAVRAWSHYAALREGADASLQADFHAARAVAARLSAR